MMKGQLCKDSELHVQRPRGLHSCGKKELVFSRHRRASIFFLSCSFCESEREAQTGEWILQSFLRQGASYFFEIKCEVLERA